jgi:hypothetical protein
MYRKILLATIFLPIAHVYAAYNIAHEKVIIGGVCKDVARFLPNMIGRIENLGKRFADYRVIIYENNSSDNTAVLLKQWMARNNKVIIETEIVSYDALVSRVKSRALRDKAPCRMEMIAYARNQVLQQVMSDMYHDFNFFIMTDLDFSRGWEVDGVLSCFDLNESWDCLAANSMSGRSYYDRYAYRDSRFPLGPELIGEDFWGDVGSKPFNIDINEPLRLVYSAFGGIGVYRKEALKDCKFSGFVTKDLELLFEDLINIKIDKNNSQLQTYIRTISAQNKSQIPIIFQRNSGYDGPVCCEHASLCASMILHGYDKIYINPRMVCYY